MKKAILFDFGGTLDTNGVHWSEKFWEAYQSFNVPVSKKEYEEAYVYSETHVQSMIGKGENLYFTLFKQLQLQSNYLAGKKLINEADRESFITRLTNKCFAEVFGSVKNSRIVLDKLRPHYKLGCVSNYYGNLKNVLKDLSIYSYFAVVVDSFHIGLQKPNPQLFQIALDKLGVSAQEAIVIGDSYDRDIQPAKRIGCSTIWLDVKSWKQQKDTGDADYTIKSINEVLEVIIDKKNKEN